MAIYEIFTSHNGRTQGFREGEDMARRTCERINPVGPDGLLRKGAPFHDYLPAPEGFYVVDMRGFVQGRGYSTKEGAMRAAGALNLSSDTNSYHVTEHRL
ncbi:hypothetical protein [Novosphingobium sp. LASN5T]|uniref:hypothetical protein n=1 Tax=Novosphingobium sp. LASN5T TaxID=2491021 RepID=UPI000F5ED518|nr:hypothetical protein [Novosphingobium sp. LASN5T]RQW42795.1 hypothetical protein EH199_16375 [Novosphingobium sp. LASN5T]